MQSRWLILMALCVCSFTATSQNQLNTQVSFDYSDVSLGYALDDLTSRYNLSFSYSKDFIPVGKKVNASAKDQALSKGLDALLSNTKVVYNPIGDYIVLRSDPNKKKVVPESKKDFGQIENKPELYIRPVIIQQEEPVFTASIEPEIYTPPVPEKRKILATRPLETRKIETLDENKQRPEVDASFSNIEIIEKKTPGRVGDKFSAQISLIPKVGTNLGKSDTITNNLSVNLIGGNNGGVEGLEIGAVYNKIENDVKGAQVAGLINHVKGDLKGTAKVNKEGDFKPGIQVAGLANISTNVEGMQIAGILNVAKGDLEGGQISTFMNRVNGNAKGAQIACLVNSNRGDASVQVSLISNKAKVVNNCQVTVLVNKAQTVNGVQFGLINISDTINGASIGLFNFTKKGYNRIEISTGEMFHFKSAYKFGGDRFYNIIQFGKAFRIQQKNGNFRPSAWALGYGFGSSWKTKKNARFNVELLGSYVNENNTFNWNESALGQLKINRTLILKGKFELFIGPSINLMYSNIRDNENELAGSGIVPYTNATWTESGLYYPTPGGPATTYNDGKFDLWIGVDAGIRF